MSDPSSPVPAPVSPPPVRLLVTLALATTLIVTAFAVANPVLAVLLGQQGHGTVVVGAFAMVPFLLVAVLIPWMPRLFARIGLLRAWRAGCALELLGCVGFALGDGLPVWLPCSVITGIGAAALWNASEALLALHAPVDRRGRVMGLYQTCLGAALAVGPFVPALLAPWGVQARGVLWVAAGIMALALLLAFSVRSPAAPAAGGDAPAAPAGPAEASAAPAAPSAASASVWHAVRRAPPLVTCALAGGIFEAGLGSVSAAHQATQGSSLAAAAAVVGMIGVGSFLAQYPAGALADRLAPRRVFGAAAAMLLLGSAGAAFTPLWPPALWLAALVWGGVGGALYTLSMVRVAHQFDAASVAAGTAAAITGYTAGGVVGPIISGAALQWGGLMALALWLMLVSVAVGVAARQMPGAGPRG